MFTRQRIKCCFIGDYNVGKTSILYSFLDRRLEKVTTTLGIDFFSKTMCVCNTDIHLSLWDTAGAERYRSLMHSYLRDAELVVLVYDTSVRGSNIVQWMRMIEQHQTKVVGVLGNKTDLTTAFDGDLDEILFPWSRQNVLVVTGTCSSRDSEQVKTFVKKCLQKLIHEKEHTPSRVNIQLKPEFKQTNKCCT